MPTSNSKDLYARLREMRKQLREEHGAEHDYLRDEFINELQPHVLEIGFALLDALKARRRKR